QPRETLAPPIPHTGSLCPTLTVAVSDTIRGGPRERACDQVVRELWIAVQIRAGVSGISRCVMPYGDSASTAAFTTAGGAPMEPAPPPPLAPSGLRGDGVQVFSIKTSGTSSARGTAYTISVPVTSWPSRS